MKRIIPTIIVSFLLSCASSEGRHVVAFNKFVDGVVSCDIDAVRKVSTETTSSMVEQLIKNKKLRRQSQIVNEMVTLANSKNRLQQNTVIVADSIASDGQTAWVRFKLGTHTEELVASMIYDKGEWLVDLPVLETGYSK